MLIKAIGIDLGGVLVASARSGNISAPLIELGVEPLLASWCDSNIPKRVLQKKQSSINVLDWTWFTCLEVLAELSRRNVNLTDKHRDHIYNYMVSYYLEYSDALISRGVFKRLVRQSKEAGIDIAVVTDGYHEREGYLLQRLFGDDFFNTCSLYTSYEAGVNKFSSLFYTRFASFLGVECKDLIIIGDRPEKDKLSAEAAGCRAILLDENMQLEHIWKAVISGSLV